LSTLRQLAVRPNPLPCADANCASDPSQGLPGIRRIPQTFPGSCNQRGYFLSIVQACLSNVIIESFEMDSPSELKTSIQSSDEFGRSFAWNDEVSAEDRALVEFYIVERLSWIPDRNRRRAALTLS
jgi:hypothetical protein